jgi:ubiquinol-cytochrome c reductase cytochrome b subunit
MLRAITSEMMYVLIVCVLLGAAAWVALKTKLSTDPQSRAVIGAAVVVSAMMLAIDAKFWGVVVMGGAVVILFFLPWLDHCPVKSIRYRPDWHKYRVRRFRDQLHRSWPTLGVQPPSPIGERVSQVGTLVLLWLLLVDALVEQDWSNQSQYLSVWLFDAH